MEGSNRRMLDEVWVKTEPLWEDSGGCVVNYTSYEVKRETPPLVVFPEKVLSINDKSKDNPISPKESNVTTGINATPYSIVCHIKKEPEDSVSASGFKTYLCSQEIKKEVGRIDGSNQAHLASDYVKPAVGKCGATGYSGANVGQTALNRELMVKVEGWESVSEEERARLYAGHQVKMEIVVGPERLQPSDAAFALQGSPELATVRDQAERERTATSYGSSDTPLAPTPDTTPEQQDSLLIVHKPKRDTYACEICKKEFRKMGKLTRHKKTHMGEKPYACGKCDKKFTRPHHLREHDRSHTGEMPYSCDLCGKKFPFARQLKHHGITHSNVKPFTCDVCQKGFTQFGHLMTHKRLHTGEKPYTCEICKREFAQLVYLKEHVRVHSGVKEYRCDVCKKEFTRMGELRRHRLIHTKDRPYECATCKKAFKQSSHLKRHQLVHTKVKQFSCDICLKCFTQKSTLGKHKLLHCRKDSTAVAESVEKVSDDKK